MRFTLLSVIAAALASCIATTGPDTRLADATPIRPYSDNPWYWEYKGSPVVLIGGTREDNLFQIPDLEEHLDLLASVGGNYVRNTMSSRDSGNVWPFYRTPDGKYHLERLNDSYFERFEELLRLTAERDIVVQIELWDRFDFAREPWLENPYRPVNNINYTTLQSGLEDEYPRHPGQNDNPFFRSIPAHDDNPVLLKYQHAQVDRLLDITFRYPNVLFTIDNETSATPEWGAYWAQYIKDRSRNHDIEVHITEMWDAWDLKDEQHRNTLDHPETYSFIDISQNNHNRDQTHWDNLQWVRSYVSHHRRPLNHVKIYGADTGQYGTDRDAVERFWRSLVGGAASIRFHRPPSGLGLNETARASIQSARLLLSEFDVFRAVPDIESRRLADREDDEAYLSYIEGESYALYFPEGGSVRLDLKNETGKFAVRWLDIQNNQWQAASSVSGGDFVTLTPPSPEHWTVLVQKN